MGQASGSLLYDIGPSVEWKSNSHWALFEGSKKDEKADNEPVSIFKFVKASSPAVLQTASQRNVQKLRTIKHPFILSFLDSSVVEENILLVTEAAVPLDKWLHLNIGQVGAESSDGIKNEVLWGLRCILTALEFLHSKCKISHNAISTHTIFVVQNGDWKIGAFDFATQPDSAEDRQYFASVNSYIPKETVSPERLKGENIGSFESDIFSLGKLISNVFSNLKITVPDDLERYLKRMLSLEPKRRPTSSSIQMCPDLNSDYISSLNDLSDIALKSTLETQEILSKISSNASDYSKAVCSHRILNAVCQKLKIAIAEFANRDSRESSRQVIQTGINIISIFADLSKVDEVAFRVKCVPIMNDIWAMSDRTVRHALLKASKGIISLTPSSVVNKNIFDAMLAGFADTNAKMREETLKNLVHLVDKLDEKQLQDRLVRCITNLQNDSENSIRTNSTIFLGRIAPKLKDTTRNRVLCQAFAKSMRDNFSHCRIAGLRSAIACMDLIEPQQLATILMPQACVMLVDRNSEIRQLATNLLESCTPIMAKLHENLLKVNEEKEDKSPKLETNQSTSTSDWTSWAVGGISKTLERVTVSASDVKQSQIGEIKIQASKIENSTSDKDLSRVEELQGNSVSRNESISHPKLSSLAYNEDESGVLKNTWDDDEDFDWNDEVGSNGLNLEKEPAKVSHKTSTTSIAESSPSSVPATAKPKTLEKSNKTSNKKPQKLSAMKIESTNEDNWDDF